MVIYTLGVLNLIEILEKNIWCCAICYDVLNEDCRQETNNSYIELEAIRSDDTKTTDEKEHKLSVSE